MTQVIIGKKLGMTQIFADSGEATPVSVIQAGPCPIVQVKTPDKDGYSAIQIGFGETTARRVGKPLEGHFKRASVTPCRVLKEVRVQDAGQFKIGDVIDVKILEGAKRVHISGVSKGRGFAGTIRRYNFKRGPESHGSKNVREPGSVGQNTTPARILKGKKLPGRMGGVNTTVKNMKVVLIDAENHLLFVRGAVPGANNGFVFIRKA
jgi:large subunit ribosomal protein L3